MIDGEIISNVIIVSSERECKIITRRIINEHLLSMSVIRAAARSGGCAKGRSNEKHIHLQVIPIVGDLGQSLGHDYSGVVALLCLDTETARLLGQSLLDQSAQADAENVLEEIAGA